MNRCKVMQDLIIGIMHITTVLFTALASLIHPNCALQRSQALWAKTAWQKAKNELKEAQNRTGDVQGMCDPAGSVLDGHCGFCRVIIPV